MKESFFYILLIVLLSCCQDDDSEPIPKEIDCDDIDCTIEDEFYCSGLLNGECWATSFVGISPLSEDDIIIICGDPEVDGIRSELRFILDKSTTNLQDTIWLVRQANSSAPLNSADAKYIYWEGPTPVGRFEFVLDEPFSYKDYLLIDYHNADTSVVTGRFQLRFTERDVSSFVTHAPDSMHIKCGSFQVEEF
jgi:hypothetical protein